MDYSEYPIQVVEDIARLRRRIQASGIPKKETDKNMLIGTWNIRSFGRIHPSWNENPGSPKRNYRALAYISEIVRLFDVIAIQEVKSNTSGIRLLLQWLGPEWGLIITDVTLGPKGNDERLAFLFDRRRVSPSGLAGEIVLPSTDKGDPVTQFARTPYAVGFRAGDERLVLVTTHILYGETDQEREVEIRALASVVADEMRKRAVQAQTEEDNLIVLGDFNIDERGDNPLFQAFTGTGLVVPDELERIPSAFGKKPKFYDQIAWFMGAFDLHYTGRGGVIDFTGAIYPEIKLRKMSYRVSDHLPLWVEFQVDRSVEKMARTLGVDPIMPNPLGIVPDKPS